MSAPYEDLLRELGAGHTGENCRFCPVCVALAVLRDERPEVTEKLATAGAALLAAFRAAFDTVPFDTAPFDTAPPGGAGPDGPAPAAGNSRVQRIDLD